MPAKSFVYRHKTVNRFQITGHHGEAPFDFKNHLLRIDDEDRNARFLDLVDRMHPRDRNQIVEINSEAAANLERSLGPRVSRTALDTSQIRTGVKGPDGKPMMSQQQIDDLAAEQAQNDSEQAARDQAAIDEAAKLIASGKAGDDAEADRLKRVAEAEAADQQAGKIDQTANQESAPEAAPALKTLPKK